MRVRAVKMFIDGHFGHFRVGEVKTVSPATADKLLSMALVELVDVPQEQAVEPPKSEPKRARKNGRNRPD